MSKSVVGISDLHLNATVSLCKPVINLDDGGTYHASRLQKFYYRSWMTFWEEVEKRKCGDIVTVLNGDAVETDAKNRSTQLISRNKATILQQAIDIIEPPVKQSAALFVVRGTEAHVGGSGEYEEKLARDLGAMADPETKNASWWHLLLTIEGVTMDIKHHPKGGGGGRPMNAYSIMDRLASDTVFHYANNLRKEPPALAIFSHFHEYKDSYDHFRTRAIITPAWSGLTAYDHRIGINTLARPGGVMINCSAGHYEVIPILFEPKPEKYYSIGGLKPYASNY